MLTVQFPDFPGLIEQAQRDLDAGRRDCLQVLGTEILSLSKLDYVTKARGGTGTDGIAWAPLTRKTIEARVRSRAPAKRIVAQRRALAEQIKTLLASRKGKRKAARQAKGGKGFKKAAKAVSDVNLRIAALREKRKELSVRLQGLIDKEYARHEIGVDTGLQRASAQPGFRSNDGKGGNVLQVTDAQVTVGYGRNYSVHFDAHRQLLPQELPQTWLDRLELKAADWGANVLQSTIENGGWS